MFDDGTTTFACVACAALIATASCKSRDRASADPVADASKQPIDPAPASDARVLFRGDVIDLAAPRLVSKLDQGGDPAAMANGTAYIAHAKELVAFDVTKGAARWRVDAKCWHLVAVDGGAACDDGVNATFYPADGTTPRSLASKNGSFVTAIAHAGDRLVVFHEEGAFDVYDDRGSPAGSVASSPIDVDHGWALVVGGGRACTVTLEHPDVVALACVDPKTLGIDEQNFPILDPPGPSPLVTTGRRGDRFVWVNALAKPCAVVVDVERRRVVARVDGTIMGTVVDVEGDLTGTLSAEPSKQAIRIETPGKGAIVVAGEVGAVRATGIRIGDVIVLAISPAFGGRHVVRAYDAHSGADRWTADLALPAGHSMAWEEAEISAAFGRVVVRGLEAGVSFLEILDPQSGAIVFRDIHEE